MALRIRVSGRHGTFDESVSAYMERTGVRRAQRENDQRRGHAEVACRVCSGTDIFREDIFSSVIPVNQIASPVSNYKSDGIVRVGRETKGRRGKGVTVITGLPGGEAALKKIAARLKSQCGVGGTVKGHVIEIQGDQRDRLMKILAADGYTVRKSGG